MTHSVRKLSGALLLTGLFTMGILSAQAQSPAPAEPPVATDITAEMIAKFIDALPRDAVSDRPIRTVLDELQIECVDYVVSSLPLAIMDNAVVTSVVESVRDNLREGGRFLQYQYSLNNYDDVKLAFRESRLRFTLRNMPPAFIYDCVK
jgi:phospholipid N-methyltransferase